VASSDVDAHHDLAPYSWSVVDGEGGEIIERLVVVERAGDGRLKRISMFHGTLLSSPR
jgi:hypothetical protein